MRSRIPAALTAALAVLLLSAAPAGAHEVDKQSQLSATETCVARLFNDPTNANNAHLQPHLHGPDGKDATATGTVSTYLPDLCINTGQGFWDTGLAGFLIKAAGWGAGILLLIAVWRMVRAVTKPGEGSSRGGEVIKAAGWPLLIAGILGVISALPGTLVPGAGKFVLWVLDAFASMF